MQCLARATDTQCPERILDMAALEHIRVPRDAKDTLAAIATMADERVTAFVTALNETETIVSVPSFTALVERALDVDSNDAADMASNFLSIATLRTSHQFDSDQLATHIAGSASEDLDDEERARLQRALSAVLDAATLEALIKAIDISRAYDRLLHTSRVLTDIRPIFGESASNGPLGALISHTLQLDYFADGRVQSISFALTNDDIDELLRGLERAEEKEVALAENLEAIKWPRYQVAGES